MESKETVRRGIVPSVPFDMRQVPPQTFGTGNTRERTIARCVKIIKGEDGGYRSGLVRVPDVVVLKDAGKPITQDNIEKIYEIKFPGDRWGEGQREAYEKIASSDPDIGEQKVEELNVDECGCEEKDKNGDLENKPVNEEVRENARALSEAADKAVRQFMEETGGHFGLPEEVDALREELKRQAEATRESWKLPKPSSQTVVNAALSILLSIALRRPVPVR